MKKYTEEQVAQIIKLYNEGHGCEYIEKQTGCSASGILNVTSAQGITRPIDKAVNEVGRVEIYFKKKAGATIKGLAKEYGLCEKTIKNYLSEQRKLRGE